MLGMLGGGENMRENLSGFLFTLEISLHKGMGGQTELISVRGGRLPVSVPASALAHSTQTAELVVILTACSIFFVAGVCEIRLSGI